MLSTRAPLVNSQEGRAKRCGHDSSKNRYVRHHREHPLPKHRWTHGVALASGGKSL